MNNQIAVAMGLEIIRAAFMAEREGKEVTLDDVNTAKAKALSAGNKLDDTIAEAEGDAG